MAATAQAYIRPGAGFALVTSFFVLLTTFVACSSHSCSGRRAASGGGCDSAATKALARRLIVSASTARSRASRSGGCAKTSSRTSPGSPRRWAAITGCGRRVPGFHRWPADRHTGPTPRVTTSSTSGPRSAHVSADALVVTNYGAEAPGHAALSPAAGASPLRVAAPLEAVPAAPGRAVRLEHHSARADHVSTHRFDGAELSAMVMPDLLGTQGAFWYFSTRERGIRHARRHENRPRFRRRDRRDGSAGSRQRIPEGMSGAAPSSPDLHRSRRTSCARRGWGETIELTPGTLSPWVRLTFRAAPLMNVFGICRLL